MSPQNEPADTAQSDERLQEVLPAGAHPLEVAARDGFGPLSAAADEAWHGNATPCVTCGQLVPRDETTCRSCGQDLSPTMLEKMRAHAGPWYVLEHLRPFPGVNLERIVKQIRRGLINETSIVRGPATAYQWRFALETPGLCRYFGKCWRCFSMVGQSDTTCQQCAAHLTFEPARGPTMVPSSIVASSPDAATVMGGAPTEMAPESIGPVEPVPGTMSSDELERLREALHDASLPEARMDGPARIGGVRVSWIATALVSLAVITLLVVSRTRSAATPESPPASVSTPPTSTHGG